MDRMLAYPAMKRLLACLLAAGPALALGGEPAAAKPFSATLEPGGMHEECVRLEAGEKRAYYWKADAPVDFNIHYHHGGDVSYPVKRDAMRGDGGAFVAKSGEDYCWMWTARDRRVRLEGRIKPE